MLLRVLSKLSFGLLVASQAFGFTAGTKETFKLERGTVRILVPSDWQSAPDLFGMPLMLLGPETKTRRVSIAVTPTGIDLDAIKLASITSEEGQYRAGRKRWVESREGHVVQFFPYEKQKWPSVNEVHAFGYRYVLGGLEFSEHSYYVVCNGKLYHLKSLVTSDQEAQVSTALSDTLHSFSCE